MTPAGRSHFAALMLLLATAAWAVSFSLAKDAGHRLNVLAGAGDNAFFGPTALQGLRFTFAAAVWFAVIPPARRGWTWAGVFRGGYTGVLLAAGILLQHLALDRTTPAATAFLTSLSVLWVPMLFCVTRWQLPARPLLIGVGLATAGIYLLLGEGLTSFRTGEMLGLGCSVAFTFHLLAVSRVVRQENAPRAEGGRGGGGGGGAWRMCGAQFAVCGVICLLLPLVTDAAAPSLPAVLAMSLDGEIAWRLGVILLLPTFVAFGLMNVYQPQVDPTRAVLIYMAEPVLASAFDWVLTGRGLAGIEWLGAGLILLANLLAELKSPSSPPLLPLLPTPGHGRPMDTDPHR